MVRILPFVQRKPSDRRWAAAMVEHLHGRITLQEMGEQAAFATQESLAAIPGGAALPAGAPAWAIAMNTNVNNRFNQMNTNVNNRFNQIDARLVNVEARQVNATLTEPTDPISPIVDNGGNNPPAFFPQTLADLGNLTNPQILQLLQFYGLSTVPVATRHQRLCQYLGIKHF